MPQQCHWDYSEELHGFFIKALRDIRAGEEITFSYGDHITNSSWLY